MNKKALAKRIWNGAPTFGGVVAAAFICYASFVTGIGSESDASENAIGKLAIVGIGFLCAGIFVGLAYLFVRFVLWEKPDDLK
jgi:hypothetical protein